MQTIEAMDQPLENLVVRKRTRGGKAGKRTRLRELHGYVPPALRGADAPDAASGQKRKLSEAKAPQKGKGKSKAKGKGKDKAKSEAQGAPQSKHAKGKAKGEAATAPRKPVTVY